VKAYIALGSNLGTPMENLEKAACALKKIGRNLQASPVFRNPALLPEDGPKDWRLPFLNAVVELDWESGAEDLLRALQCLEKEMGREKTALWAPRLIDLDLLALGELQFSSPHLFLPHKEALKRSFVLDPLKHLAPGFIFPGQQKSVLRASRELSGASPTWMGILNLTPDSFTDGDGLNSMALLEERLGRWDSAGVQIFDLGGESTRPGAMLVSPEEEWKRLSPALTFLRERYHSKVFRPTISVDTRSAEVAARAIEMGASIVNDVSGLTDPAMIELLKKSSCQYVLMHSLSVPADPKRVLPTQADPIKELLLWVEEKIEALARAGISRDRIFFDPGLGFGKSAAHSLEIVERIKELLRLPVRVLVGHSRKSFLNIFGERSPREREGASLGVTMHLAAKGVDVLRIHEPDLHLEAWQAWRELGA